MAGRFWTDAEIARLMKAGQLYESQWRLVTHCETWDRTYNALWTKYNELVNSGDDPPAADYEPLRIETDPEAVAEEVAAFCEVPTNRSFVPSVLQDYVGEAEPVSEAAPSDLTDDLRDYQYIDGTFLWVVNEKLYAVEYERWDAICHDYSEHGGDLTQAEVARKHGVPLPILKRILRRYGQYKASPPNCRERISDHKEDFTPLVEEAIENDEYRFLDELQRKRDQEWRKEYIELKKQDLVQQRMIEAAERIAASRPTPQITGVPAIVTRGGEPWEAHVPTTDEHGGKYVWGKESFGEDYDTPETCRRLVHHAEAAADWIASQPGECRVIHRSLMGDLFHALTGETEHGTNLDQDTRSAHVLILVLDALERGCRLLARTTDHLHLRGSKGNHDGFQFTFAMVTLRALLRDVDNITVHVEPGYYDSWRVGSTLHVIDHGYRVGNLTGWKAKAQAEVVAREVGGADFHGAEQIITYVGHLHEEQRASNGSHLKLIRLPSLGESDDFETSLRYASQPAAHLFRLDPLGRICDERVLFRDTLSPREKAA